MDIRSNWDKTVGVLLVLTLHGAALWGLWTHRLIALPDDATTLFVNFISPPPPRVEQPPKNQPPKPRREEKPQSRQLVAEAAVISPGEAVALPPPQAPAPAIAAAAEAKSAGPASPVTLGAELSVSCPERTAPNYPLPSRRMNETGTAVLRVELDEQGRVAAARIASGSGYSRLDEAALAAVKTWRCNPAQRNGQAVRAIALQPFKFVLQGG